MTLLSIGTCMRNTTVLNAIVQECIRIGYMMNQDQKSIETDTTTMSHMTTAVECPAHDTGKLASYFDCPECAPPDKMCECFCWCTSYKASMVEDEFGMYMVCNDCNLYCWRN